MASKSAILSVRIISDAKGAISGFNETDKAAGGLMGKLGGKLGPGLAFAGAGLVAIGAAALEAGKFLYSVGETFDEVEDTIRTKTGATGDALEGLVDVSKTIGTTIPAQFEDIGPVVGDLNARLGLTGDTLTTVGSQYLEAGRLLGENINIDSSTAAFNAFHIAGDDVSGAMDTLFRVSQGTGVGINDLTASIQKQAPALTGLGFSFEESAALVGTLDKAGLDADKTLAGMGKSLVTLAKQGEEPQAAFQRVTGEIDGLLKSGDQAAALDLASTLFGTRGATQFVGAIQSGSLNMATLAAAAVGTGDTILGVGADTMDAAEKWEILKNKGLVALEPLGSAIFTGVGKALDFVLDLVGKAQAYFQGFAASTGPVKTLADAVMRVATTIGQFLIPYFQNALAVGQAFVATLVSLFEPLVTILGGIFNLIGAVITGDWSAAGEAIKTIAKGAVDLLKNLFTGLKTTLSAIWTGITSMWTRTWTAISNIVGSVVTAIVARVRSFISSIGQNISSGVNSIGQWWSNGWNRMVAAVVGFVSSLLGKVRAIPGQIRSGLGNLGSLLYAAGRDTIQGMINGIGAMGGAIWDAAQNIASNVVGGIKNFLGIKSPSRVLYGLGINTGDGFINGMKSKIKAARTTALSLVNPPELRDISIGGNAASARQVVQEIINITVNGALDPDAVARQIERILRSRSRRSGSITIGASA